MRNRFSWSWIIVAMVWIPFTPLSAQNEHAPPTPQHDNSTPEAVISALYASNSVVPGGKYDWPRFRALFAPDALLRIRTRDGGLRTLSVENFIAEATKNERNGFVERELVRRMEKYGHIAHAWSSYEAIFGTGDARQVTRGVNSFQLALVQNRWVITTILWETTRSGGELPADMESSRR
jgi:hypothetical protein